jgi:ketosteroid isomerase-like protein
MLQGSGIEELEPGPPTVDGGSPEDQQALITLWERFFDANDRLDIDALRPLWSADPGCVFFNTNGHVYHGIDDWANIWDHYRAKMHSTQSAPRFKSHITIRSDMAVMVDEYVWRHWDWTGDNPRPSYASNSPYLRSTLVCARDGGEWKVVHSHFSSGRTGLRPDQGGAE